ncbi:MAG: potassium transporter TrkG [Odoribacter splanchnicus]
MTPRTAGFNTVDLTSLLPSTWFLTLLLMWIGASPLSTGGGDKNNNDYYCVEEYHQYAERQRKNRNF